MVLVRNKTVAIKKSEGVVPDYTTFCDLVEDGAFGDPATVTQVVKQADEFLVSFQSPEMAVAATKAYKKETTCGVFYVDPVGQKRSYIKVYDLPYELPSQLLKEAFLEYGTVGEITRDKFPGRSFLNGIRTVPIFLNLGAEVPDKITLQGFSGRVLNTAFLIVRCARRTVTLGVPVQISSATAVVNGVTSRTGVLWQEVGVALDRDEGQQRDKSKDKGRKDARKDGERSGPEPVAQKNYSAAAAASPVLPPSQVQPRGPVDRRRGERKSWNDVWDDEEKAVPGVFLSAGRTFLLRLITVMEP
ncbi:hypothetical protein AC249_AIPGENE6757 [Exaiptasia diaphana]|nr:hypothetical protein AC249_AIPGENE6757 [Exaiptasia diaphana]